MRTRLYGAGIVLLLVFALVTTLAAKPASVPLDLASKARIGGKQIPPGSYRLVVSENSVRVMRNKDVVVEAPGEWVLKGGKAKADGIRASGDEIREIYVAGKVGSFVIH